MKLTPAEVSEQPGFGELDKKAVPAMSRNRFII